MHLVERAKDLMVHTGAEWVLWLLIALSVASIAVILERALALRVLRCDVAAMRTVLRDTLRQGGFAKARIAMAEYEHPAAFVLTRGMDEAEGEVTPQQAESAMAAEAIAQRKRLEKSFSFLATLGANAPFIGLFGTVIGILQAFDRLGSASVTQAASAIAPQAVMSSIAEALVATAVGIGVAIPAVFAFNLYQRLLNSAFDDARMLQLELVSYLHGARAMAKKHAETLSAETERGCRPTDDISRATAWTHAQESTP